VVVRGRVRTARYQSCGNAVVRAFAPDGAAGSSPADVATRADAEGRFSLDLAGGVAWRLHAREDRDGGLEGWRDLPPLPRVWRADDIDIVVGYGASVSGCVVDDLGAPVEGIDVQAGPRNWKAGLGYPPWTFVRTDASGRFDFYGLEPTTHFVRACRPTEDEALHAAKSELLREVLPPASGLELVLPRTGHVEGKVRTSTGRVPEGLRVFVDSLDGENAANIGKPVRLVSWESGRDMDPDDAPRVPGRMQEDLCEIESDGTFRVERIRPGRCRVVVDDVAALPTSVEFDVTPASVARVAVQVVLRGSLDVSVVDHSGTPVEAASVDVLGPDGAALRPRWPRTILGRFGGISSDAPREEALASLRTDVRGRALRRYLDPGPTRLRIEKDGFAAVDREVAVPESENARLEVRLERR
jgi:hypothetical protein